MASTQSGKVRVAVDIGGTFTDLALLDSQGVIHQGKISSTPDDPSRAVVEGVELLLSELKVNPLEVAEVLHGTTVGSNTILQRTGAKTGLITTRGFKDVLEIGRIRMPDMFDLTWDKKSMSEWLLMGLSFGRLTNKSSLMLLLNSKRTAFSQSPSALLIATGMLHMKKQPRKLLKSTFPTFS
jgi:hypothetical protein